VQGELVDKIVAQVIAALSEQVVGGDGVWRPGNGAASRTVLPRQVPANAGATPRRGGRVFVTAEMLEQRLRAGGNGSLVELSDNEFLTPNAVDLADQRRLTIRKRPKPSQAPLASAVANSGGDGGASGGSDAERICLGLVTARADDKVHSLLGALSYDGLDLADYTQPDCWIGSVQSLCDAIAGGRVAFGVAILPYGANAMVLANKIKGIRAVQGTRSDSVSAAVRHLGANLLIVEHAFSSFHEMRVMIRTFADRGSGGAANQAVLDALEQLER
jgi:ribose 5-phosphate isomerase RpiB